MRPGTLRFALLLLVLSTFGGAAVAQAIPPNAQPFNQPVPNRLPKNIPSPPTQAGTAKQLPIEDIHLPGPVKAWPPAPGWWISAVLLLFLVAAGGFWCLRYWRSNRYRRQAISELSNLYTIYQNSGRSTTDQQCFAVTSQQLLRRCAVHCYGATQVAALTGEDWLRFLHAKDKTFDPSVAKAWLMACYAPEGAIDIIDVDQNLVQLKRWIKRHRRSSPGIGLPATQPAELHHA